MANFTKIALFGRARTNDIDTLLRNLVNLLQPQYQLVCEKNTAKLIADIQLETVDITQLGNNVDLVIVVGGDGSMLRAAKAAINFDTPVIGINKGRLGFLTDIRPYEIDSRLLNVLNGQYWMGKRCLLHATLQHDQLQDDCGLALNDIVLSPSHTPNMLEFEIFINDEFICSHHADGLIVATPTGSTAYALSGGGPIIHPNVDGVVILPMFSHTLSARPIVVPGDSQIRIDFSTSNLKPGNLYCSGEKTIPVPPGASISIEKHKKYLQLLHPMDYNYYETLRSKLHWGQRLAN